MKGRFSGAGIRGGKKIRLIVYTIVCIIIMVMIKDLDNMEITDIGERSEASGTQDNGIHSETHETVVPDAVMQKAEEFAKGRFLRGWQSVDTYTDWRIESLKHVYTYDDFNGMTLAVYCLNYQFLSDNPEELLLPGGMSVDGDGWVTTEYPNSNYLIYRQNGDSLTYLSHVFENDCYPGDDTFTSDLQQRYDENSLMTEADKKVLICYKEGEPEENPATLTHGDGYTIYITDNDWEKTGADAWTALLNEQVRLQIEHSNGKSAGWLEQELCEDGYTFEDKELVKREGDMVYKVRLNNAGWKISYCFPTDAEEGWGMILPVIADTFYINTL